VVSTTVWYMLGDPYGIDNIYIALVAPMAVMLIERLVPNRGRVKQEKPVSKSALRG